MMFAKYAGLADYWAGRMNDKECAELAKGFLYDVKDARSQAKLMMNKHK